MTNSRYKYLFFSLILVLVLIIGVILSLPDQKLHLIFCNVGQGDAILIIQGQNQILVDGGPNDKVLGCLSKHMPFWDRELETIILTHPESDHLTGIVSVIERYNVKHLITNSLVAETAVFSKFKEEVTVKKIPVYSPKSGDKIKISNLTIKILFPLEKSGDEIVWKTNDQSQVLGAVYRGNFNQTAIVSELEYGQFKALLTADTGIDQEKQFEPELETVNVLKVAHHGSKTSTSDEFLARARPSLAVISVGAGNRYGHPTSEVLSRLKAIGAKIYRTDLNGEVEIVSDGKSWYTKSQND